MLSADEVSAIKKQIQNYVEAAIGGNWDGWGSTLADDVSVSPANVPPLRGREAAVVWARNLPRITAFAVAIQEVAGAGSIAFARGTYELEMVTPDGTALADRGAFLQIHRRAADGTWPYAHMMFHSIEPADVAATV
jgi:ketosteroid isomerase-like protein